MLVRGGGACKPWDSLPDYGRILCACMRAGLPFYDIFRRVLAHAYHKEATSDLSRTSAGRVRGGLLSRRANGYAGWFGGLYRNPCEGCGGPQLRARRTAILEGTVVA